MNYKQAQDKLKTLEAKLKEIDLNLSQSTKVLLTDMLKKEKVEVEKDIAALKVMLVNLAATDALATKDWTADCSKYPVLAQAYNDTMGFNTAIEFNTDFYRYMLAMANRGEVRNGLIYGPTGTGKTTLIRRLGYDLGRPVISINASNGLKEEDIFGNYVIDEDTGKPRFVLGPLIIAMLTGAIFVIEEINGAKQGVLLRLNSVLDDLQQAYVKEVGETFKAAPGFMFFGTFNPGYAGTRRLNLAFINRFQFVVHMDTMSQVQLEDAIKVRIPDVTDQELLVSWLVFKGIVNAIKKDGLDGAISVRQLINMIHYYREYNAKYHRETGKYKSWWQAARFCVGGQVSGGDDDLDKSVRLVMKHIKDHSDAKTGLVKEHTRPAGEAMDALNRDRDDE